MTLDQQEAAPTEDAPRDRHIQTGTLFRRRSSRDAERDAATPEARARASAAKAGRILALAHHT
jgi:hypothetical protein